jgi:hypothetical protein
MLTLKALDWLHREASYGSLEKAKAIENYQILLKALTELERLQKKEVSIKVVYRNNDPYCECGKSLEEYSSDGSLNKTWWNYCPDCGVKLDWRDKK